MRKARQERVTARRINQHEIAGLFQACEAGQETLGFFGFGLVEITLGAGINADNLRHW